MSRNAWLTIVAVLVLISVGLVLLASALDSYVPLFFCWLPQLAIPWVAAKSSAGQPAN
jgi:hypothetical protein